jgi:CHAT domain-containing protein
LSCVTDTMKAWKLKRGFVEEEYYTTNNAVALLTAMEQVGGAWEWVQRSKAASMADMLRMHVQIPEAWKESLGWQDRELLQKEQNMMSKMSKTKDDLSDLRYEIHEQHQVLLREMRGKSSLQQIMIFRGQIPMPFATFDSFLSKLPHDVVWVDWAIVGETVMMYVLRPSKPPRYFELGEYTTIMNWVKQNVEEGIDELRDHPHELRRLDFLVRPLRLVCSSSDILVLCPTALLHRIPLHALQVEDEVLGVRNRVVQCPSAAIFHHMFLQRESRSTSLYGHFKAEIIGNPSKDDIPIVRISTSSSCYEVAKKLKTLYVHVEENLTVKKFKEYATAVDILHYHGHSIYSSLDEGSVGLPLHGSETLRVSDIIDLKMNEGAHISLIACSSKDRKITTAGDEQLGFVSAFMFAGAGSCIATLWKIPSTTGKAST